MKPIIYSVIAYLILFAVFALTLYAFAPQVSLPPIVSIIIGGFLGMMAITLGHLWAYIKD